jgi:hypothetical protein
MGYLKTIMSFSLSLRVLIIILKAYYIFSEKAHKYLAILRRLIGVLY